jgi:spore coat protein CotH
MLKFRYFFCFLLLIASCNSDEEIGTNILDENQNNEEENPNENEERLEITSFAFLAEVNETLVEDIVLTIDETSIYGIAPQDFAIDNLIASFEHSGTEIRVNNVLQTSGITSNDFTNDVIYEVRQSDGTTLEYTVRLSSFEALPITYITTNDRSDIDSRDYYKAASFSIEGAGIIPDFEEIDMEIRGRGNSTWALHDKKAYQIKFLEQEKIFDLPKDRKWVFLAEYSDKTLIRNKIALEMGYLSNLDWTPLSVFTEVYINNAYNGLYHVTQKVEESNQRVALGDTGYLLEIDQPERLDADDVFFRTYNYQNTHNGDHFLFNIKEPKVNFEDAQYKYIRDLVNDFENALRSNSFKDPNNGYAKYIDVDSFVDYYLINEITKNQDAKDYSSIYLHVMPGEKIKMGPIWDFDLAFGNVDYSVCAFADGFWIRDNAWYNRLFQDPAFAAKVRERFAYFRSNQDLILEKMDFYANQLRFAQQQNDARWDLIGRYVWPNFVVFETYEEEVQYLKSWFTERMNWLDRNL